MADIDNADFIKWLAESAAAATLNAGRWAVEGKSATMRRLGVEGNLLVAQSYQRMLTEEVCALNPIWINGRIG